MDARLAVPIEAVIGAAVLTGSSWYDGLAVTYPVQSGRGVGVVDSVEASAGSEFINVAANKAPTMAAALMLFKRSSLKERRSKLPPGADGQPIADLADHGTAVALSQ